MRLHASPGRLHHADLPFSSIRCPFPLSQNNLLRFPIVNEFFQPAVNAHRTDGFARAKGYRWERPQAVEVK